MRDYTPDVEQVREQYTREQPPQVGSVAEKRAEFDRFIARIKAEALRETEDAVREEAPDEPWAGATYVGFADWMAERADQIEEDAGQSAALGEEEGDD